MDSKEIENLELKITDFGFACYFDPKTGFSEVLGSPLYMAPEIIRGDNYDIKVDIWSIGVITYILLCGKPPFKGRNKQDILYYIENYPINYENLTRKRVLPEGVEFVKAALTLDPKKRPSAAQLLKHDWMKKSLSTTEVDMELKLDVAANLEEFRRTSNF